MRPTRTATFLALTLSVAGCFKGVEKTPAAGQKGQFGVFYVVSLPRPVGGTITSTDGQVNCGSVGSNNDACGPAVFEWKVTATFNAVADVGQVFQSWAGDCSGVGSCVLDTVSSGADKTVVAVFNPPDQLGHARIPDPAQHGPMFFDFVKKVANTPQCSRCHGADYRGLANAPSCETCHSAAGYPDWLNNCNFCHGNPPAGSHVQSNLCSACHAGYDDNGPGIQATNKATHMNGRVDVAGAACTMCHGTPNVNAAPPIDTLGRSATNLVTVGAHQIHLNTTSAKPVACGECHVVPTDAAHASAPPASKVSFGALANLGTVTVWNSTSATCASNYCHGGTSALAGGVRTTPLWTQVDGTFRSCATCHGAPPPAPHAQNSDCGSCHTGYTIISANAATHVNGTVDVRPLTCTTCHGDAIRTGADPYIAAAPPLGTKGETTSAQPAVGAHLAHMQAGPLARAFACTDCHLPPSSMTHATGTVEFSFSVLAGGSAVTYDTTTRTCSNTYCHGSFTGGYAANRPVWTAGTAAVACNSCHGTPPAAPHTQSTACGSCHAGYTATSVNTTAHVNGIVDVVTLSCTSCHGSTNLNAAPPVDSQGRNATNLVSVGAHQSHVRTTLMAAPIACTECHGAASAGYDTGHADATVQVAFGSRANQGTLTTWNGTTCASSYCHGGTTAVTGGTGTAPAWTQVDGTFKACASCHGAPPPAPHVQNTACGSCHSGYTSNTVAASSHVNGLVEVVLGPTSCNVCHGAPPATSDHRTASGITSCSRCHDTSVDASGNILAGGTHRNGSVDTSASMSCASCHGTPGRTPNPTSFTDSVAGAPPKDLSGNSAASFPGVGAHLVHTNGLRSKNLLCSECHDISSVMTGLYGHANGTVDMAWGTLATLGGVTPAYVLGSGSSCNSTYCHGNFPGGAGAGPSPAWTTSGTLGCASCHGAPPALNAASHHPGNSNCGACHGAGYASTTVVQATHVDGTVNVSRIGCTLCHGDLTQSGVGPSSAAAAPGFNAASVDTVGNTLASAAAVGAHAAHVNGTRWRTTPVACGECHTVPGDGDVSHATGAGTGGARATVSFGTLARTGGITTAGFSGSLTGSGGSTSGTCSNTYCHGNFQNGSLGNLPAWLGGAAAASCGSCHGLPPGGSHPASSACGSCHGGYAIDTVNGATHLNGSLDVTNMSCTSCHGDAARASVGGADPNQASAPPVDTNDAIAGVLVGTHLSHVNPAATGQVYKPVACTECHPNNAGNSSHSNNAVNVTFATATAANLRSFSPTFVQGNGATTATTCATYCHGSSLDATTSRGSVAIWSWDGAAADCGSCHKSPPGTANHHNAAALTTCNKCHGGTVDAAGVVNVAGALHVNGAIDTSTLTCTTCHGNATLAASGLQDPNVAAAPTGTGAPDTFGNSAITANGVGVHAAHVLGGRSRPVLCNACHTVPGTQVHKTGAATAGTVVLANLSTTGSIANATYAGAGGTCSNTYCHGNLGGGIGAANVTPTWKTADTLVCNACHGVPPAATSTGRVHPNRTDCDACHTGYTGTTVIAATHVDGTVQFVEQTCTSCHGDPARSGLDAGGVAFSAAPPADAGGLLTGGTKIGAHAKHLLTGGAGGPTWSKQVACAECHSGAVPVDPLHANGQANIGFGTVATTGAVAPAYAGNTCSNTYCHGNFSNGAGVNAISWSAGTAACGSCHGNPPGGTHPAATVANCGNCHPNYDNASQSISNAATHVDGNLDVNNLSCTSCHGATGRASVAGADLNQASAPPVVASATGVAGAHLAHVNQGSTAPALSRPMACSSCHVVPSSNTHANAVVGVTYAGLSVAQGAVPSAYDGAGHTCSNTYCHGNFPGGNRSASALSWSASGKLGCTACHGVPPALSAASHHPANTACATCHGTGYSSTAVVASSHVDGLTTLSRTGCTLCHGDLTQTSVAETSDAAAPGFNTSAADTTGATAATSAAVGAHKAHLTGKRWRETVITCSECHTVPGTSDVTHATGAGTGGARATIAFGTLARTGSVVPAYTGSTTAAGANGAGTCSNTYCHGNFTNGAITATVSWLGGPSAAACGSCHGSGTDPLPGGTHPSNPACENCHTGYTIGTINPAFHMDGSVQVDNLTCTDCHGSASRAGVAGADVNQGAAPPLDSLGASTGFRVGVHEAHVNPATIGAVFRPVACVDCHPDNAGNNSHSNGTRDVVLTASVTANLGGLTATRTLGNGTSTATTCTTYCHGATMAVGFTGSVGANWSWTGAAATCGSCHGFPPSVSHTGVLAAATDCNRCHGGTVNPDGTINVAGGLHINGQGDGGGEPNTGGSSCGGCHADYFDKMTAVTGVPRSRHGLGSDVPLDGAFSWTGATLGASVPLASRTCISMCHGDHPHNLTSPATATHENNVYVDATTQATRGAASATRVGAGGSGTQNRAKTDFDSTANAGLCASCHQRPIVANGITVAAATFGASAHDFSSNTVGGTTYTWSYGLHDGGSFARNCTKCHASRTEGNTPSSSTTVSVHYSADDVNLLAGTTNPAGSAANFACYNCHGSTTTPAAGAQGNRSGKDIQSQVVHATTANQSGHPSDSDTRHDSAAEFGSAGFGNALGVTAGTGQRHASCMDCHDSHEARATTDPAAYSTGTLGISTTGTCPSTMGAGSCGTATGSGTTWTSAMLGWKIQVGTAWYTVVQFTSATSMLVYPRPTTAVATGSAYSVRPFYRATNVAGPALQGAWGAQLSSNPAYWTAPAAGNFTKQALTSGTSLEATLCFKCHTGYYWGTGVAPVSPSGFTYTTGTATASSGGTTVTGTGTTWTAAHVGANIRNNAVGTWHVITGRASNTSITISPAATAAWTGAYTIQMAETDVAKEFNPANAGNYATTGTTSWQTGETAGSFHPILASASGNLGATGNILPPFSRTSLMQCSDCHESDVNTDPNGPHGSASRFILKGPNTTWNSTVTTASTGMPDGTFCANCHRQDFVGGRFAGSSLHLRGNHRLACFNCHSAIPHGGPRPGLLVAPAGASTSVGGTIAGWDTAAPYSQPGTGSRLYILNYPATNTTAWQEASCGCNGSTHH